MLMPQGTKQSRLLPLALSSTYDLVYLTPEAFRSRMP